LLVFMGTAFANPGHRRFVDEKTVRARISSDPARSKLSARPPRRSHCRGSGGAQPELGATAVPHGS
jgi:hypothetical protein